MHSDSSARVRQVDMPCVFEKVSLWFVGATALLLVASVESTIHAPFTGADVPSLVEHVLNKTFVRTSLFSHE